ncbi:MAG: tetratricopeptide repeat protein [Gammaproteobacteria bacterium]|uniref:tetratricopeptide repeat protein n=1 Tax=Pseudomaricurvus alcaniphilus TaxID=1166482 RepID=UPI00140D3CE2|nr:tetratricopeptide repeat protein [Pseudomaricurvus alcaniphilus]MBR9912324.1 tetratricopeptide repeat protein [Gammaproteobacteria bacterium]NHN39316.1 tetratricopeptide repeat protein [Pseudomaricurvus alcaniphilus]
MSELPQETTRLIKRHCAAAYGAYDKQDFKSALRLFYQAWLLLPKPQAQYPEAGWILTGIGDTYYRLGQYQQACEALQSADFCPDTSDNPFIHLRLGQCLHHMDRQQAAKDHLCKAHRGGGDAIFSAEAPLYLQLIADQFVEKA